MVSHRAVYIAIEAIHLAEERESFKLPDVKDQLELDGEQSPSNSTIRRVLQQLEESEWLQRNHPEGRTWKAGPVTDTEKEIVVVRPYMPPTQSG